MHIEGHINWTNSTANFLTTGTLGAGAGTLTNLTLNLTQDYLFTENASSLAVQGQTAATGSLFHVFSNDGDGTDGVGLYAYGVGTPGSIGDSESLGMGWNPPTNYFIASTASGSGTARALWIYTGANTSQLILATDGNVSMAGNLTVNDLIIGDAQNIGSASDTDAIAIAADGKVTFSQLMYVANNITHSGDVDTYLAFSDDQIDFYVGGVRMLTFDEGAIADLFVVNEGGADIDFRVEGVGQANALFVQGSDGKVGVRDGAPGSVFDVNGDINTTAQYKVDDTQVVTNQQGHIADSSTQDLTGTDTIHQANLESDLANIVAAVNSILSTMETHGLVAAA
jgi:hypothetical protein